MWRSVSFDGCIMRSFVSRRKRLKLNGSCRYERWEIRHWLAYTMRKWSLTELTKEVTPCCMNFFQCYVMSVEHEEQSSSVSLCFGNNFWDLVCYSKLWKWLLFQEEDAEKHKWNHIESASTMYVLRSILDKRVSLQHLAKLLQQPRKRVISESRISKSIFPSDFPIRQSKQFNRRCIACYYCIATWLQLHRSR